MSNKISQNPWTMDVRVRERNLKSGSLTEKDLEKNLAALPDLEGHYDAVGTAQPALEQPVRVAHTPVSAAVSAASSSSGESDTDLDDEEDDEEDEDEDEDEAEDEKDEAVTPEGEGGAS